MRQVHVAESGSGSLAGLQVVQNSGSRMFMLRVKPCQREFATDEIRERKYTSTECGKSPSQTPSQRHSPWPKDVPFAYLQSHPSERRTPRERWMHPVLRNKLRFGQM